MLVDPEKKDKERAEREYKITIRIAGRTDLYHLQQFLCGRQRDMPQETIQVLDVVLRESPSWNYDTVSRSFFSTTFGHRGGIGKGLECWRGYYQSLQPAQMGLSLNIDISAASFFKPVTIIKFVEKFLNMRDISRPLSDKDCVKIKKALRGFRNGTAHQQDQIRRYKITGVTSIAMSQLIFPIDDKGTRKTVVYFWDKYNYSFKYGYWPCLEAGSDSRPVYLPMEVCKIVEGQRYSKNLNDRQVTNILRATCECPQEREQSIRDMVLHNKYTDDRFAQEFGIKVSSDLMTVPARVLPPPLLKYHDSRREKTCAPSVGQWNMINKKMINGGTIDNWICLNFSCNPPCQELRYILDWRYVKVVWDESTAGERQPRLSLWEMEPLKTFPMYPSPFLLKLKRPWSTGLPSLHGGKDDDLDNSLMWLRDATNPEQASPTMLQFEQPQNISPSLISQQAHAQFQQQPYLQNTSESSPIQVQGQSESLKQLTQRQLQHQESEQQQQAQCLQVPQHEQMQQQNMCHHMSKVQFIVILGGRSLSKQRVLEETTVKDLIESCCHEIGIRETNGLYGVLCGKTLSNEIFLCHYPIHRDSTIDIRSRLRGGQHLDSLTTRFSKPDGDLFYCVTLPYELRNRFICDKNNKTKDSVWNLKRSTRFSLKQVLVFFTSQHRAGNCFNGAFEKDDILFRDGAAYLRDGIVVHKFSGQGVKLDYNKLSTILELKTSDGYYTPYFLHLLHYLKRCPFGENSNSDLPISFVINHPAIEHFNDRMKQIQLGDAFLIRIRTNSATPMPDIIRINSALGDFHSWWCLLENCRAMKKVLYYDSYVNSVGDVVYNALYSDDPAGAFHYSNNFFKHAKKKLGLQEIEAAHSMNAPGLLPEVLENITGYAIDPKNAGFAKQFKVLVDLIGNDLADPNSEHSQDN